MKLDDDIKKRIELAGFTGNQGIEKLAMAAALSRNPIWKKRLERILEVRASLAEDTHPFLSPDDSELGAGEIWLGNILRMDCSVGGLVALPVHMSGEGVFVSGTTGSGKTYLLARICKQLLKHVNVLIFDRDGQFVELLGPEIASGKIAVVSYSDFKRNLLEPMPNEAPLEAINRITSAWRGGLFLRDASENMLAGIIRYLYKERGVFEGSEDYPSLIDLHQVLLKMKYRVDAREKEYWQTLRNRVEHLVSQVGDAFDCCQGFDIQDLLNCSLILNLMGLSDSLMRFVVEDFVSCALAYRERLGSSELRNIFMVDEAHRILSGQSQRYDIGEALLHTMARTTRKRGIGLILADQVPGQIPSAVMANMGTRIALRLLNGPCIRSVAESMSLEPEQRRYIPELANRRAILHFPGYPRPFLIEIPELDFSERIAEDEIKRQTWALLQKLKWVPRTRSETSAGGGGGGWVGEDETARVEGRKERNQHKGQERAPVTKEELRLGRRKREALEYINAIQNNPFVAATERDRSLGLSAYKGNLLRKVLLENGLIVSHQVSLGRPGHAMVLVEITSRGWEFLRVEGFKLQIPPGRGGWCHRFWQNRVRGWFLENYPGCRAEIEQQDTGNKAVDIGVEIEGRKLALEVLIEGEEKELKNMIRDLEAGWDEVTICCLDKQTIERTKNRLKDAFGDRYDMVVSFKELREFLAWSKR